MFVKKVDVDRFIIVCRPVESTPLTNVSVIQLKIVVVVICNYNYIIVYDCFTKRCIIEVSYIAI